MVEFVDGSILAQIGPADMRLPIQYALTYPRRRPGPRAGVAVEDMRHLTFEEPDRERFPALELGWRAAREGGTAGAVLNAANEVAVDEFLAGRCSFADIPRAVAEAMDREREIPRGDRLGVAEIWEADRRARERALDALRTL
jgi:1-deoxy-D-xylulose-5-phosphate reductoisomerase